MSTLDAAERAAFIDGLVALARFLDEHPDILVPSYGSKIYVSTHGTDEEDERTVDQAAAVLGVAASWDRTRTHYDVSRSFGPVEYEVGSITSEHMARYRAHQSYADAVEPDEPVAA